MSNVRRLVIAMMLVSSVAQADNKKYTLADLKALNDQSAFKEAFLHIGDIAPAQRKAEWLDVAATAAGGVLGILDTDDGSTAAAIDQIDKEYPALLKSAKYTKPRAELGYQGLEGCFSQTNGYWSSYGLDNCIKIGMRFVANSGGDKALALKVAKLARRSMNSASSVPFFEAAVGKDNKALCADSDFKIAVVAGIALPPDYPNAPKARKLMVTCWDSVKDAVLEAFEADSEGGYIHQNACETLIAKKLLSGLQLKQCTKK
ncbi:MAG: hypothetical protein H0T42_26715 [Deltaproteobacteria bacterium]|nr:hypothetical protein [Deltaproteobacteria bacterium]